MRATPVSSRARLGSSGRSAQTTEGGTERTKEVESDLASPAVWSRTGLDGASTNRAMVR